MVKKRQISGLIFHLEQVSVQSVEPKTSDGEARVVLEFAQALGVADLHKSFDDEFEAEDLKRMNISLFPRGGKCRVCLYGFLIIKQKRKINKTLEFILKQTKFYHFMKKERGG